MLFIAFGASMAFAVPTATVEITYFQTETTHFAQSADVSFAARAPPMAADNVVLKGGVTVMRGSAFALHGQETVAALFGFSGGLDATNTAGDTRTLYRGVGADEYTDIMDTGGFRPNPNGGSFETGKQFGYDLDEVLDFSDFATDISGVVKVEVPTSTLNNIGDPTHVDPFVFRSGTVTIPTNKLDEFNSCISGLCDALD